MKTEEIKPNEQLTLAQINLIRKQAQADSAKPKQDTKPTRSKKAEPAPTDPAATEPETTET